MPYDSASANFPTYPDNMSYGCQLRQESVTSYTVPVPAYNGAATSTPSAAAAAAAAVAAGAIESSQPQACAARPALPSTTLPVSNGCDRIPKAEPASTASGEKDKKSGGVKRVGERPLDPLMFASHVALPASFLLPFLRLLPDLPRPHPSPRPCSGLRAALGSRPDGICEVTGAT